MRNSAPARLPRPPALASMSERPSRCGPAAEGRAFGTPMTTGTDETRTAHPSGPTRKQLGPLSTGSLLSRSPLRSRKATMSHPHRQGHVHRPHRPHAAHTPAAVHQSHRSHSMSSAHRPHRAHQPSTPSYGWGNQGWAMGPVSKRRSRRWILPAQQHRPPSPFACAHGGRRCSPQ